mmetsp:Transcript_24255/g.76337  ORF Transcript_24255/g.76337 Transcript_24255/m.76337 type:complete len:275 (-) Transcript_24255:217-1041(-)
MSAGSEAGSVAVSATPPRSAAPPAPSAAPPLAAARRQGCAAAARLASLAGGRPPPLRPTGRRPSLSRRPPGSARARLSRYSTARGRRRACLRRARRRRRRPGPRAGLSWTRHRGLGRRARSRAAGRPTSRLLEPTRSTTASSARSPVESRRATFHSAAAVSSLTRMMEAEAATSRCCVVTPSRVRCSIASSQTSRPEYSVTVSVLERAHAKMADIAIERAAQTESSASAQKRRPSTMVTMARRVRMQAGRLHRVEAASSALPTHLRRCISSSAA